jgi:hypothetical protein
VVLGVWKQRHPWAVAFWYSSSTASRGLVAPRIQIPTPPYTNLCDLERLTLPLMPCVKYENSGNLLNRIPLRITCSPRWKLCRMKAQTFIVTHKLNQQTI